MKTIIDKINNWEKVYFVRKSKWIFLLIILKVIIFFILSILILYFLSSISWKLWNEFKYVEIWLLYLILFISYIAIITSIVGYFYNVFIVTNKWIYKFRLWLFFTEDVDIIDLYKVQEIKSKSEWFINVLLNIGELHLVEQKDSEKIIHFIDSPEKIAQIIKWVQHKLVEKRYSKK